MDRTAKSVSAIVFSLSNENTKNKRKGEKIMKKIIGILLALVMLLSLFSGCGGNDTPANTPQ